ncbi:hypothetical protein KCP74_16320 [Salmonella enterica subsp. enterica]|nr:hypothetical protein KCP74_16320 [Salmonella enterica subsp. enterica]
MKNTYPDISLLRQPAMHDGYAPRVQNGRTLIDNFLRPTRTTTFANMPGARSVASVFNNEYPDNTHNVSSTTPT